MTESLINKIINKSLEEQLAILSSEFSGRIVFSTSFGQEDQLITDMIFKNNINIEVFSLDTGRLFEETYKVFQQTRLKYSKTIHVYFPDHQQVENMLAEKGPYSFYESVENRQECCHIRKVIPLSKALTGMGCWITGLRGGQSENRRKISLITWDEKFKLYKFNPLKDWSLEQVVEYLKINQVPYNSLHDNGFISIGCAPCTKAVKPGQDIRSGRWWWEDNTKRECGLHKQI
jgi:phosphoadenosine phosphosulfate reductase